MYYDISQPYFPDMVIYPGDPPFAAEEVLQIQRGDVCNLSRLSFGSHTGTHIDAPKHFFDDGLTVDRIPLDHFMGQAKVCEITGKPVITGADLAEQGLSKDEIVIIKTDNSKRGDTGQFHPDFVALTPDAARYLVEIGIKTLGVDYFSVESPGNMDFPVHKTLLGNGIIIIEGLVLGGVPAGKYRIAGFPLNIKNGNGSPIRVVLFD